MRSISASSVWIALSLVLVTQAAATQSGTPPTLGISNCPVAPEAIYIAREGAQPGLSVIDLNGFGQGTGNPVFHPLYSFASEGTSMFPFNPNVVFQGALIVPPLAPGTSTLDGGSSGVFTLTRDTNLNDLLIPDLEMGRLGDMMLGHPLDTVFNNSPAPFGCQVGGGNLCATTGLKSVGPVAAAPSETNGPMPNQTGGVLTNPGLGNAITWAPHPNPPKLITPPLCQDPELLGQEPTSIDTHLMGFVNLLFPGSGIGNPAFGIPPQGLIAKYQTTFFGGPSSPQVSVIQCEPYQMRQQVGHFLYAIDEDSGELVILNSNRMTLLGKIALPDPTELAIDPNLNFLAVTNSSAGTVSVIDINPASATFHQVVTTIPVGSNPTGIAWQPDNEDLIVCNSGDNTISLISAFSLTVRKVLSVGHNEPFAVAITPRHTNHASQSNVYYAWILDRNGRVWVFESGPNGPNGWGYDDIIMKSRFRLQNARTLQLDPLDPAASVWVVHDQAVDINGKPTGPAGGAVSKVTLNNPLLGPLVLVPGSSPNPRLKSLIVPLSIGPGVLTGQPLDLAFDNLANLGVYPNPVTPFSAGIPAQINGKHPMRETFSPIGLTSIPANRAKYMFLPTRSQIASRQRIDVIDLATGMRVDTNPFQPGVQSIPARGAHLVMDYFRQ